MRSYEFTKGYEAFQAGYSDSDNPFCPVTERSKCEEWSRGFDAGMIELLEGKDDETKISST